MDFLKAVFILLMITFHLVYFSELHLYAKQVVYTFHMPGFLIISGYLMNIGKPWKDFAKTLFGYAIPYIIMESGYIVMASVLPIREHIDRLTLQVFMDRLFLNPVGPYWYLQTLMVCGLSYALVFRLLRIKPISKLILLGIIYYLMSCYSGTFTFAHSLYFLIGVAVRQSGRPFTAFFQSSAFALLAFVLLAVHPENLNMEVLEGMLIIYLVISGALFAYHYTGQRARSLLLFLGRRTMPLFLFSPIFTFLCKPFVSALQFEPTGLLFLIVSLMVCVSGSLTIEWAITKTGLALVAMLNRS